MGLKCTFFCFKRNLPTLLDKIFRPEIKNEAKWDMIENFDICSPGHNILARFNNLAQVRIATSKTILDMQYNKLGTRVASRAELLKT